MAEEWYAAPVEVGVKGLETSEQARTRRRNFIALVKSMRMYGLEVVATVLATILKHGAMFAAAIIISYMTGRVMQGTLDETTFWSLFWPLIVAIVVRVLFHYGEMWWGHDVAYKVLRDFRIRIFAKLRELAPAFMVKNHSGKVGTTLMSDVEQLEWFLAHTLGSYIAAFTVVIIALVALAFINPLLSGVTAVFAALAIGTPFFLANIADRQGREVREKLAHANKVTIEGIQGLRELLTLNGLDRYREKDREAVEELYAAQYRYGRRQGIENGLMQLFVGMFTVFIMVLCATLVMQGELDFAWYPVAVMMSTLLFVPIIEVSSVARNLGNVTGAADRIQQVLDEQVEVPDEGEDRDVASIEPRIEFKHVSFTYDGADEPALDDVSFAIEPGETVALVGPSGSGKTTCSNMLLRTWDVDEGSVSIGGHDIRSLSLDTLHECMSAVLQDVYLFNISVKENIGLGRPEAGDEEITRAAQGARIHEYIESMPRGYDTNTGERGALLSGGQRQRISIARAILRDAPILILDEAVSSLDTENEREIQKTIDEQLGGRTVMVIAHRLSTILSADRIVVLNRGKVEATGTHEELLGKSPFYRDLIATQLPKDAADE